MQQTQISRFFTKSEDSRCHDERVEKETGSSFRPIKQVRLRTKSKLSVFYRTAIRNTTDSRSMEAQVENNAKEETNKKRSRQNESVVNQRDRTKISHDEDSQPGQRLLFSCMDCDSGLRSPVAKSPSNTTAIKYTPLEKQYLDIKAQYPDAMLLVECGYKYRLFGKDAVIAAELLNIFCHMEHNFETASFPVHRLGVHLNRMVASGYKVGVVKQTETAALKAVGSNKSNLFDRKLVGLYTKSTLIGVDSGLSSAQTDEMGPIGGFLVCVVDEPLLMTEKHSRDALGGKDDVEIGIVAVNPSSGEIVYDWFHDAPSRSHLELCLLHVDPVELLLPHTLTTQTSRLIEQTHGKSIRIQYCEYEVLNPEVASVRISRFYEHEDTSVKLKAMELPQLVTVCLACLLQYLEDFKLEAVLKLISHMQHLSGAQPSLKLNNCAVKNLEIFHNQTDGCVKGSLLWLLDHTTTAFGKRLLRQWLSKPPKEPNIIEQRMDAIAELVASPSCSKQLQHLLSPLPDLEHFLLSVFHSNCSPAKFVALAQGLQTVYSSMSACSDIAQQGVQSAVLRRIFTEVPCLLKHVNNYLIRLNITAVREGNREDLFVDTEKLPSIAALKKEIESITSGLKEHLIGVRRLLSSPDVTYVTVMGYEYLIEVKKSELDRVPREWDKINGTKHITRFRSPFVNESVTKLSRLREQLQIDCEEAWIKFLGDFAEHQVVHSRAVHLLATLDCLLSLSKVARQPGYCRPVVDSSARNICIKRGRNPISEALLEGRGQYVPNDTNLVADGLNCMVISGPNMGGKSSYMRQVSLICIMAQIGSYVPAESAHLAILDAVYTRMGASDNIYEQRSTFMTELLETSEILHNATAQSLVILDELGRGTSTHDGAAIAYATLKHLIENVQCYTLFVSHYPSVLELEGLHPSCVANFHVAFIQSNETEESDNDVTFLYQLERGSAKRSFGLHVAKMAGVPREVVRQAAILSSEMEQICNVQGQRKCDEFITVFQSVGNSL